MSEYDWDFEAMSNEELDALLEETKGSKLEAAHRRLIEIYKELRSQVAEGQVPDAFKDVIQDMDLDESETTE